MIAMPPTTMRGVTIDSIGKVQAPKVISRKEITVEGAADSKRFWRWRKLGAWWQKWTVGDPMPNNSAELFRRLRGDIDFIKFIALFVLHECRSMTCKQIAGTKRGAPMFLPDHLSPGCVPAEIEANLHEWLTKNAEANNAARSPA